MTNVVVLHFSQLRARFVIIFQRLAIPKLREKRAEGNQEYVEM